MVAIAPSAVATMANEKRQAQYSLEPAAVIENNGEPWRARTSDPLIKSQLLYQLS